MRGSVRWHFYNIPFVRVEEKLRAENYRAEPFIRSSPRMAPFNMCPNGATSRHWAYDPTNTGKKALVSGYIINGSILSYGYMREWRWGPRTTGPWEPQRHRTRPRASRGVAPDLVQWRWSQNSTKVYLSKFQLSLILKGLTAGFDRHVYLSKMYKPYAKFQHARSESGLILHGLTSVSHTEAHGRKTWVISIPAQHQRGQNQSRAFGRAR